MNFIRTYQLVFAFGLLAKIALGAKPHTNFPKALAEAKAHNKPVFIYVYDSIWGRFCRALEKEPEADRAFAKLAKRFVVLHFDTRNGRAPHVARLKVKRNQTYAIVLRPDGTEIGRTEKPVDLKPVVALMKNALKKQRGKPKPNGNPRPL